ncbi:MAG: hypothetical protein ACOC32_01170 [Nanoarchaeota archaeon]
MVTATIRKHAAYVAERWKFYSLFFIFALVVAVRLYFAFQTPEFSDDSSYFVLKQIEHIRETGLPILETERNTGDMLLFPPAYYYVLSFFTFFMPATIAAKVVPNIFAATTIFLVYLLSMRFTRNQNASLFAATLSGFIPVFFLQTFNSISIFTLVVPLVLLSFYAFLMIGTSDKYIGVYIFSVIILSFTHPAVFFVVLGQIIYFIFVKVEGLQYKNVEQEVIIVSLFIVLWSQFLIFKNAFLFHGPSIIWQNAPTQILSQYFRSITIVESIALIGIIPTFAGVSMFFQYVRDRKSKFMFFFLSYAMPLFILLWMQLIRPMAGLILLSSVLIVVLSKYYQNLTGFIEKTKFSRFKTVIIIGVLLMVYLTSVSPTFALMNEKINDAPSQEKVQLLRWMKNSSKESEMIMAPYQEAFFVEYYSGRSTVLNMNFLMVQNVDQVVDDIREFYTTYSLIDAIQILDRYDVDYVYISDSVLTRYGVQSLRVAENDQCFEELFAGQSKNKIYEVTCSLQSVEA